MAATARRSHPLLQLILARLREFHREPEALFWVYGFPLLMTVALGIAFRNQPIEKARVDVVAGPGAEAAAAALADHDRFVVAVRPREEARLRLRTGRTDVVVTPGPAAGAAGRPAFTTWFDPARPPSRIARDAAEDALQAASGRTDPADVARQEMHEPGGRYIDFLVPGLLGMGLMGGGLWGVGYVTVDMRIRKLLKRFLATPMRKSHFLAGIMLSRLLFMVPEVLLMLLFARIAFGVRIQGSLVSVLALVLLGALTFSGIGLMVASRAKTIEAVSGLMNLVMLPMWLASGVFFSSERFPEAARPFIRALPLTPLNDALRAVINEGASLATRGADLAILAAWAAVSFAVALLCFRWR